MARASTPLQERLWRLDRNKRVLANQRQLMETLSLARQLGYGRTAWYDQADELLLKVAYETFRTAAQIAEDAAIAEALEASE